MKKLILIILTLLPTLIFAHSNYLILSSTATSGSAWIIKNISKQDIYLDHPRQPIGAGAGWLSYLKSGHYSAIQVNSSSFALSCAQIEAGKKPVYLDCNQILQIAPLESSRNRSNALGSYWIAEDQGWLLLWWNLRKQGLRPIAR